MAKGSNNRMGKQVRDVQSDTIPPAQRQIEVNPGNTAILTVQLLNDISKSLIEIKELLKNG